MKQVLLYLPVVHAGHEAFFARHADAAEILLLGRGFRDVFKSLAKDIRALPPDTAALFLRLLVPGVPVRVIEPEDLPAALRADTLVLPDEDVSRTLAADYRLDAGRELVFDRTFLRWDREWSQAQRRPAVDAAVTGEVTAAVTGEVTGEVAAEVTAAVTGEVTAAVAAAELPAPLLDRARELAGRSSDWWRQVGAVAWRGPEILGAAWNHHSPTEYAPYTDGDPRDNFSRGVRADLSTAVHAEASIVARAARAGTALDGADLYVTTFPCPACARLIAESGFRRCYFSGGYSVLDGDAILRAAGVELLWVDPHPPPPAS